MSFRDNIENDIQRTFFNVLEFAEEVQFFKKGVDSTSGNYETVTVVFYPDNIEIKNGRTRENLIGDSTLYIKKTNTDVDGLNFTIEAEVEDYIIKDNKIHQIIKVVEETIGSFTCRCISYEAKLGISNKNIRDFRTL